MTNVLSARSADLAVWRRSTARRRIAQHPPRRVLNDALPKRMLRRNALSPGPEIRWNLVFQHSPSGTLTTR